MRFIVKRKELWIQVITVEAPNVDKALEKAKESDGLIEDDPRFVKEIPNEQSPWEIAPHPEQ